ncbi:hypothetical protein SASPL_127412 [Salvia splendens]|uniref:Disease resistance protein RPM1 n=1 Tax=Salvia splendens TaxID=180675 RepID=A0A8X8X9L4_SALSN|nr:hypothetical protein SASPL_127412 [Salvia splendens]
MAAYAALASLVQTTVNRNHSKSHFSTYAKEKIGSIHEYAVFLLTFLEYYPERASRWEGKLRDLAHEAEDIIEEFTWRLSFYGRVKISSFKFEEELRNVTEKFGLIAGDVMDERPAYSSLSLSSSSSSSSASSRVAVTGNGVAIGLKEDVMAIKDRLSICNLMNLQTLTILPTSLIAPTFYSWKRYWLSDCDPSSHLSLPLEIWRMPQLRHILLCQPYTLPHPPNDSNPPLENLHTLSYIKNLVWNENILKMIPNVKRLGLVYMTSTESHLNLLKHLDQLEKLKVHGYRGFSWQRQNPNFPSTLKKLTLVGGKLPWEDITRIIGSLPNLQMLKLRGHACWGETWETVDGGFPNLEYLLIEIFKLQHWITERSHLPRLKCLVLHSCPMLREIPEGIGQISTLELIEVDHHNISLVESAKQIKEDQESYGNYGLHVCVTHSHEIRRNSLHTSRKRARPSQYDAGSVEER